MAAEDKEIISNQEQPEDQAPAGKKPTDPEHLKVIEARKAYQARLKQTVKNNLLLLFKDDKNPKKEIAQICGVRASTVTRWTTDGPKDKEPFLPGPEYLKMIADEKKISVDWLLSDHMEISVLKRVSTYADAVISMAPLINNGTINVDYVNDQILRFLCNDYRRIFVTSTITEEQKTSWINDVQQKFNIPIPEKQIMDSHTMDIIRKDNPQIANKSLFEEYANLARYIDENREKIIETNITPDPPTNLPPIPQPELPPNSQS